LSARDRLFSLQSVCLSCFCSPSIPPAALTFRNTSFSWQHKDWFYCVPAIDRSWPCDKGGSVSDKVAGKKSGKSTGNLQIVVKFLLEPARQPAKADKKPTRYYGF